MRSSSPRLARSLCLWTAVLVAGLLSTPAALWADAEDSPADSAETRTVAVDSWLVLGPVSWPLPAVDGYALADALAEDGLDLERLWPAAGDGHVLRPGGEPVRWSAGTWEDGTWDHDASASGAPSKAWAATYLEVDFFTEATLQVRTPHAVRVLLDGAEVASRAEGGQEAVTADLKLEPGKHLLLVTTVHAADADLAGADGEPSLSAELTGVPPWAGLAVSTSPRREVGLSQLLDQQTVRSLDLSPDGRHLRIQWSNVAVPADHRQTWSQIVDATSGEVLRELRDDPSGFAWSPDGDAYAWAAPSAEAGAEGHDLWLTPAGGGEARRLLTNLENWAGHRWLPDGSGLVVQTSESAEADDRGFKRYRGLTDRWAGARDVSKLWWVPASGGALRRLGFSGPHDQLADVGVGRVLIFRQDYDSTERPFIENSVYELDLETMELRRLASEEQMKGAVSGVRYLDPHSPDDRRLLVTGSPQLFDGAGRDPDLPADVVVNDYEGEVYVFDPATGEATALTRDWDPAVNQVETTGDALWILGQERSYQRLYRYSLATDPTNADPATEDPATEDPASVSDDRFVEVPGDRDMVSQIDLSRDGSRLVYVGEGPSEPEAVFVRATAAGATPRRLARGGDAAWEGTDLGRVDTFSFVMDEGTDAATEILGRVNYPPDFDPSKKYPLIVSYYAGTVPSSRSFGGRYPRSYWAAHGFVVYTLQPSGATGFGQEFSARHVNAWGRRTADEILEGTKRFLDAHPFVDRDKVGCIGASYGGFMTLYLVSHSDLFAAAVSHAGISNLASYWGQGWWGYLYSAAASADSYPWNARDLYIDQSPLYQADEIHTPVLLLHGDRDTNVPPVESHQMYTALKLLGRDVELIEVGGEDHQIFFYPKRKLWMETIVAYFTRTLHDRPEWWAELWGTAEDPKG